MAVQKVVVNGKIKYVDDNGNYVDNPTTGIAAIDSATGAGASAGGAADTMVEPTFMQNLTANAPAINAGVAAFNTGLGYMSYLDKKPLFKAQTSLLNQQIASNQKSAADKETFNKNWGTGLASAAATSAPRIG